MLVNNFSCTYQGRRDFQLDRIGFIKGGNWSVTFVLDGFVEVSPHAVDCFSRNLIKILQELNDEIDFEELRTAIFSSIELDIEGEGKLSLAILISCQDTVNLFSCGDTRIYALQQGIRTIDHSRAQELVYARKLRPETLNACAYRKYLTRYLSKQNKPLLDEIKIECVAEGNSFLICSDGFWSQFDEDSKIFTLTDRTLHAHFASTKHEDFPDNTTAILLTKQ